MPVDSSFKIPNLKEIFYLFFYICIHSKAGTSLELEKIKQRITKDNKHEKKKIDLSSKENKN